MPTGLTLATGEEEEATHKIRDLSCFSYLVTRLNAAHGVKKVQNPGFWKRERETIGDCRIQPGHPPELYQTLTP